MDGDAEVRALPARSTFGDHANALPFDKQDVRGARGAASAASTRRCRDPAHRRRAAKIGAPAAGAQVYRSRKHADPPRQRRDLVEQRIGDDDCPIRDAIASARTGGRASASSVTISDRGAPTRLAIDATTCSPSSTHWPSSVDRATRRQGAPLRAAADCSAT
jgi:hypothetical protein